MASKVAIDGLGGVCDMAAASPSTSPAVALRKSEKPVQFQGKCLLAILRVPLRRPAVSPPVHARCLKGHVTTPVMSLI
eukprot:4500158-Prymnesium_polylepis.1